MKFQDVEWKNKRGHVKLELGFLNSDRCSGRGVPLDSAAASHTPQKDGIRKVESYYLGLKQSSPYLYQVV